MVASLLAFADRVPNQDAIALSPTLGWLMLAAAVCVVAIFLAYADRWRAWWMTLDDPRSIAVFRIAFSFFVIANINGMWEHFTFLFTDEGIFPADVARQVFARKAFAGFGDGMLADEPWGFFDWAGFWQFLGGGKWSLLYLWDSPTFFWAHMIAFWIAAGALMIGFRTRLAGVLTWFLMNSILIRNHLGWEGTELVFRCFLAILIFARSGHAYSVDNWLRCRKLRRAGLLSEVDGPGGGAGLPPDEEHPQGLQAIYRAIPSWPRKLLMLQLATIYITTGTLKTGGVWLAGDSLYYALNLDHFYRVPPQLLSSLAGTTVFRGMTWAVKVGQTSFSLIIVGIVTRWMIREGFAAPTGLRKWAARLGFAGLIGLSAAIAAVAWPVHFTPAIPAWAFVLIWSGLWLGVWGLWRKLTFRPWTVSKVGPLKLRRPAVIDRTWVCRWIIGRRVLLVWHVAFHAHIFTLMNVGQFQTAMLSATFVFLQGREIATLLRDIHHRIMVTVGRRAKDAEPPPVVPEEDPALAHRQRVDRKLPAAWLVAAAGVVLLGIVLQAQGALDDWRWAWLGALAVLAAVAIVRRRRRPTTAVDTSLAYGGVGRFVLGSLLVWHLAAVMTWLLPDKDCLSTWRPQARHSFATWLDRTTTSQGWGMFAPNPPRSNVFMKVLVTDENGEVWDLHTDVYSAEQKPIPWIWNDRRRKMNRRIIGGESGNSQWYRKWYARYECRQWAREHGGSTPQKVELVKVWYAIPSPEQTHERGYYVAEDRLERAGHEKVEHTERCERTVMGQLPNYIRERDGLPLLPEDAYRPWIKHKRKAWQTRHERD